MTWTSCFSNAFCIPHLSSKEYEYFRSVVISEFSWSWLRFVARKSSVLSDVYVIFLIPSVKMLVQFPYVDPEHMYTVPNSLAVTVLLFDDL